MYTLIIDGNFFGKRILHGTKLTFNNTPESDKNKFLEALTDSLSTEIEPLENAIDSIIIARDYSSWRKKETPVIAPEILKEMEEGDEKYKSNRDKIEKDYDEKAYFEALDEWCDKCENKLGIPVLSTKYAEADDIVYVVSFVLNKKDKKTIMWSSDGDYPQMLNENNIMIKLPKKQLYFSKNTTSQKKVTLDSIFSDKKPDRTNLIKNNFQGQIVEVNPMKKLFIKLIYGDKKDNVNSIFMWKSKTGSRNYRPSEAKIKKSLNNLNKTFDDLTENDIYNEKFIKNFFKELLTVCKQNRDIDSLWEIYKWNLKSKHLNKKQIPKEIIKNIYDQFKEKGFHKTKVDILKDRTELMEKMNIRQEGDYFENIELE